MICACTMNTTAGDAGQTKRITLQNCPNMSSIIITKTISLTTLRWINHMTKVGFNDVILFYKIKSTDFSE